MHSKLKNTFKCSTHANTVLKTVLANFSLSHPLITTTQSLLIHIFVPIDANTLTAHNIILRDTNNICRPPFQIGTMTSCLYSMENNNAADKHTEVLFISKLVLAAKINLTVC